MENTKIWDLSMYYDKVCLWEESGEILSYRQVDQFARELAGIAGRCLVFVLCSNSIGSAAGYIAFIQYGAVPVLINANIDKEMLEQMLDLYHPTYLWMPMNQTEGFSGNIIFSRYQYCLLCMEYGMKYPLNDKLGLLLTTSGSTGSLKFVRQSYENIRVNAAQIAKYLELDSSERPITTLPMNYTYGLSIIHSHLMVGATILLTDKGLMQRDFWDFFKSADATSFGGVPYTYEMLERLRFRRMELPSLRYMTQAGGKLLPELHKKFAEYAIENKKKFIVMYGQCEATARMGYLPAEDSLRKYGSMGIAIPGGRFVLIDESGKEITEPEVVGELVYSGANVTMGYAWKPEDLALGDVRHGRLETGDMAQRDREGYYYIVGRKKRFLKVYGNRVNLDELDGILKHRYGTAGFCCAGVDDHVTIFVEEEARQEIAVQYDGEMEEGIRRFISEKTGLNQAAFQVVSISEIPKNDVGKIQYRELQEYLKATWQDDEHREA